MVEDDVVGEEEGGQEELEKEGGGGGAGEGGSLSQFVPRLVAASVGGIVQGGGRGGIVPGSHGRQAASGGPSSRARDEIVDSAPRLAISRPPRFSRTVQNGGSDAGRGRAAVVAARGAPSLVEREGEL